jgi:lysyl endopeptidase
MVRVLKQKMRRMGGLVALAAVALQWGPADAGTGLPGHLDPVVLERAVAQARAEAELAAARGPAPLVFAAAVPLDLGVADGVFADGPDGPSWTLWLQAPGAYSLSVALEDVQLPRLARMYLVSADGRVRQGPYRREDLLRGIMDTAIVPGDRAELQVHGVRPGDGLSLRVSELHYGFLDVFGLRGEAKTHDEGRLHSGSCNVDVACPLGNDWRPEIRGVVSLLIAGRVLCSGGLVNNTAQDLRPLILTARHCGGAEWPSLARRTTVYWNYQRTTCGSGGGSLTQNQPGTTLVMSDSRSDTALLLMDNPPLASYDAHYLGLESRSQAPQGGVGIHHPGGDLKKISAYNGPLQFDFGDSQAFWNVLWSQGVTEPGSSGSPLFDQNKRIVGVLSGGSSSCDSLGSSDFYGATISSWDFTQDPDQQLAVHLDTAGTCQEFYDGRDASAGPGTPAASLCGPRASRPHTAFAPNVVTGSSGARVDLRVTVNNSSGTGDIEVLKFELPPLLDVGSFETVSPPADCGSGTASLSSGTAIFHGYRVKPGQTCAFSAGLRTERAGTHVYTVPAGAVRSLAGTSPQAASVTMELSSANPPGQDFVFDQVRNVSTRTLAWDAPNAEACTRSGAWSGASPTFGDLDIALASEERTYTLTCSNSQGSAERSLTVPADLASTTPGSGSGPSSGGSSGGGAVDLVMLLILGLIVAVMRLAISVRQVSLRSPSDTRSPS